MCFSISRLRCAGGFQLVFTTLQGLGIERFTNFKGGLARPFIMDPARCGIDAQAFAGSGVKHGGRLKPCCCFVLPGTLQLRALQEFL